MTIKDFKVGQKAYILCMYTGRNKESEITETVVEKVGRKYVTVQYGRKYEEDLNNPYGLIESGDYGERTYLCPSRRNAEMYVERDRLQMWLHSVGNHGRSKYTLEQLRKVKAILEQEG